MKKIFLAALIALAFVSNTFAASSYFDRFDSQYYFRYMGNDPNSLVAPDPDANLANITVYYNGIVGVPFNERVPIPAKFQNLTWSLDLGPTPEGLNYSQFNFTFSGNPTGPTTQSIVKLGGYDENGIKVAKATINFTIYSLDGAVKSQYVDIYGHVGKYLKDTIPLPTGVVIDHWTVVNEPPSGITYNGRYVQGTPTVEGQYPIFNIGYDYNGKMVFVYQGKLQSSQGPLLTFFQTCCKKLN